MRDKSCGDLVFCFTPKTASAISDSAGRSDSNAADVVRCLNVLTSLDMRNIASDDVLTSLVTVTRTMKVNPIRVMMLTSIRRLLTS